MKVKDVIIRALRYVGREQEAATLSAGGTLEGESAEAAETMLYCFNAVQDELARRYFTLVKEDSFLNVLSTFEFSKFPDTPIKILSVTSDGREISFTLTTTAVKTSAMSVTIKYQYTPSKRTLSDDSGLPEEQTTERMLAAGAASEYCLINGEMGQAQFYEDMYRKEIDLVRHKKLADFHFPPRRWA